MLYVLMIATAAAGDTKPEVAKAETPRNVVEADLGQGDVKSLAADRLNGTVWRFELTTDAATCPGTHRGEREEQTVHFSYDPQTDSFKPSLVGEKKPRTYEARVLGGSEMLITATSKVEGKPVERLQLELAGDVDHMVGTSLDAKGGTQLCAVFARVEARQLK